MERNNISVNENDKLAVYQEKGLTKLFIKQIIHHYCPDPKRSVARASILSLSFHITTL